MMKSMLSRILILSLLCAVFLATVPAAEAETAVDACGLRGWDPEAGYQYVIMGYYPYEKDETKAPVLWQVLGVEDEKAMLLTTYIIDVHQPIEVSDPKIADAHKFPNISSYSETDLYVWLNDTMINDLLGDEPVLAAVTEEEGYGRLYPPTDYDMLKDEYGFTHVRYYEQRSRWAFATPYTLNKKLHPKYGSKVQKDPKKGTSSYWLAALKRDDRKGNEIKGKKLQICAGLEDSHKPNDTNIGHLSNAYMNRTTVGLRLAVRLDTSHIQVISGNGSIWDPCRLAYVEDKEADEKVVLTPPVRPEPTPVATTPAPVKDRPTLETPGPDVTPVPVPDWITD